MATWSDPKTWNVGDILTAADMNTYVRDNTKLLRSVTGMVDSDGTILAGTGFSVSGPTSGIYTITFTTAFPAYPAVVAAVYSTSGSIADPACKITSRSASSFGIATYNNNATTALPFFFIAQYMQ